ncbi:MAG: four helix bundle protein [Planctomycetes bacterium]|nr:four helix bundle protein [Planctomycetota bacterium]
MKDYRELQVWEKSHRLALDIYKATQNFPKVELYGVTSQLRRAAASIPTNLAEGCGRRTDGELAQFAQIAAGSASETDYLLLLCHDLQYIDDNNYAALSAHLVEIRKMLTSLIKTLRANL